MDFPRNRYPSPLEELFEDLTEAARFHLITPGWFIQRLTCADFCKALISTFSFSFYFFILCILLVCFFYVSLHWLMLPAAAWIPISCSFTRLSVLCGWVPLYAMYLWQWSTEESASPTAYALVAVWHCSSLLSCVEIATCRSVTGMVVLKQLRRLLITWGKQSFKCACRSSHVKTSLNTSDTHTRTSTVDLVLYNTVVNPNRHS